MKDNTKKLLSMIIVLTVLIGSCLISSAKEKEPKSNQTIEKEQIVEKTIQAYFRARKSFLATGEDKDFVLLATPGIISDEGKHKDMRNPAFSDEIVIRETEISDDIAYVEVVEKTVNGNVLHEMTVFKNIGEYWFVISDGYRDIICGFTSVYYISPDEKAELKRMAEKYLAAGPQRSSTGSIRKATFLTVADGENGYLEKASDDPAYLFTKTGNPGNNDYTKYGDWFPQNGPGHPWYAKFVAWCGNQAGLSINIIPKMGEVQIGINKFTSFGRYVLSSSGYTPVAGDVFFQKDASVSHTGIVVSATSSSVYVIDGNGLVPGTSYEGVKYHYISCAAITGYGRPNWCYGTSHDLSGVYDYEPTNIFTHWEKCTACGDWIEEDHNWMDYVGYYQCTDCGMISGTIPTSIGESEY